MSLFVHRYADIGTAFTALNFRLSFRDDGSTAYDPDLQIGRDDPILAVLPDELQRYRECVHPAFHPFTYAVCANEFGSPPRSRQVCGRGLWQMVPQPVPLPQQARLSAEALSRSYPVVGNEMMWLLVDCGARGVVWCSRGLSCFCLS